MEFLKISDGKLKVTLTREECSFMKGKGEGAELEAPEVKAAVRDILIKAAEAVGFSIGKERLLVQLYPLPNGDGELFVTKLGKLPRRDRSFLEESDTLSILEDRTSVYRFSSIELLREALASTVRGDASLEIYEITAAEIYIRITEPLSHSGGAFVCLCEFGDPVKELPIYAGEYGRRIYDGPISEYPL